MELARGFDEKQVAALLAAKETERLRTFLRNRHRDRFFAPIGCLRSAAQTYGGYGFSMMSLCCLLVETIQCFRMGLPTTDRREWDQLRRLQETESVPPEFALGAYKISAKVVFRRFFLEYGDLFPDIEPDEFYANVRCGLLHQAQTQDGWTISIAHDALCDRSHRSINRNRFADSMSRAFRRYLEELGQQKWVDETWKNTARKIWWLARLSARW